jgi:ATP/maltotriose-dependent transcriptional regulator MalT
MELEQIQAWLQDASVRLVEITASGGYGKTFLVAKAFAQVKEQAVLPTQWVSFNQSYAFAGYFSSWGKRWMKSCRMKT